MLPWTPRRERERRGVISPSIPMHDAWGCDLTVYTRLRVRSVVKTKREYEIRMPMRSHYWPDKLIEGLYDTGRARALAAQAEGSA